MRRLDSNKRAMILSALVEGNSVNSTARLCGCSKVTVLRLLADAGTVCASIHEDEVRNLYPRYVQVDEVWAFCGCKDKAKDHGAGGYGSVWTWTAIDAETKLVLSYITGQRDAETAHEFIRDVADRIDSRIQLTSDGFRYYLEAVAETFAGNVDFARLVKVYGSEVDGHRRYSPAKVIESRAETRTGRPDPKHISTSYIERQNLSLRMGSRRFTRLTNAFSKKLDNHRHALALHYWWYNWGRKHQTLKTTPAVACGLASRAHTTRDLVEAIEREEARIGGRITDYLPSSGRGGSASLADSE